jgi:hypothetical protein
MEEPGRIAQVVIVTGVADPAAARSKLEEWSARLAKSEVLVELQDGYPKLVHSADYPGLRPGFEIAIAGFCRKQEIEPILSALRRVEAGTYARTVSLGSEVLACPFPTLKRYLAVGYVEVKGDRTPPNSGNRAAFRESDPVRPGHSPCSWIATDQ